MNPMTIQAMTASQQWKCERCGAVTSVSVDTDLSGCSCNRDCTGRLVPVVETAQPKCPSCGIDNYSANVCEGCKRKAADMAHAEQPKMVCAKCAEEGPEEDGRFALRHVHILLAGRERAQQQRDKAEQQRDAAFAVLKQIAEFEAPEGTTCGLNADERRHVRLAYGFGLLKRLAAAFLEQQEK